MVAVGDTYQKLPGPPDNWVWSAMDAIQMHSPERWGYLQFGGPVVNASSKTRDRSWTVRECAMEVYRGQRLHFAVFGFYASDPEMLLPLVDRPYAIDGTCAYVPVIKLLEGGGGYVSTIVSSRGMHVATISANRTLVVTTVERPPTNGAAGRGGLHLPRALEFLKQTLD